MWYSPDGSTLNEVAITTDFADFYAYVDITVTGVYPTAAYNTWYNGGGDKVGEKPTALTPAELKPYAGEYDFAGVAPVTTGARDRGRISVTAPTDAGEVCSMGTDRLPFKVAIVSDGSSASENVTITGASAPVNRFYVSVQGNDTIKATSASEAEFASFTVTA